jgi:hypothetical protein
MCREINTPENAGYVPHFVEYVLLAFLITLTTPFHALEVVPMVVRALWTSQTLTRAHCHPPIFKFCWLFSILPAGCTGTYKTRQRAKEM